ncbi:MAG: histidinol-phosphatase [Nitratireductor sp.]|nr:histidinol-phosphatase [Nitratireductor sp.]
MALPVSPDAMESFLLAAAEAGGTVALAHFRRRPDVANKEADKGAGRFDPVTEGDRGAEAAIRALISERFPDHGILGEEYGSERADARYCWVIDPIDGTRAFISGLPSWGCLIGLMEDGMPIAGIMHQPFTGENYLACGEGGFLLHRGNRERLAASGCERLADATLMTTSREAFGEGKFERFEKVSERVRLTRFGFDCYAYAMVAAGHIDLVIESGLHVYDIAALIPLIEQAGGIVTGWDGKAAPRGGDIIAAASKALHAEALAVLNG